MKRCDCPTAASAAASTYRPAAASATAWNPPTNPAAAGVPATLPAAIPIAFPAWRAVLLTADASPARSGPTAPIDASTTAGVINPSPAPRYCVDWSEEDHHFSGALGAALAARLFNLGWVTRLPRTRAVLVTDAGRRSLAEHFAVALD
jgi:hypothetical protein